MILYTLVCSGGHEFEGWFRNANDFDAQSQSGHLTCPVCGDIGVSKALMAPAVSTARDKASAVTTETVQADAAQEIASSGGTPGEATVPMVANPDARQAHIIGMMRKLKAMITESADDVGTRFADEARRIHYGEAEKRGIYGQATPEDARDLIEEGIEVMPLPVLPEDKN